MEGARLVSVLLVRLGFLGEALTVSSQLGTDSWWLQRQLPLVPAN